MIDALTHFDFLRRALVSGLVIGCIAPVIGVFLVVRRLSMIADSLSHVTLTGIAFSLLLSKHAPLLAGLNPVFMGMTFSVGGALAIEKFRHTYRHYQEIAIPLIMSTGIGFGVLFISLANGFNTDLFAFLFGSIIAVRQSDMVTIVVVGLIVLFAVCFLFKELFSLSFDEENARTTGMPRKTINFIFIVMVALVIAAAMRIVGILLVSSLMVLPVAASMKIAKSFKQTFFYAVLFGELAVLSGMYFSYVLDWAPGGTIVVFSFLILCIVLLVNKWLLRAES